MRADGGDAREEDAVPDPLPPQIGLPALIEGKQPPPASLHPPALGPDLLGTRVGVAAVLEFSGLEAGLKELKGRVKERFRETGQGASHCSE